MHQSDTNGSLMPGRKGTERTLVLKVDPDRPDAADMDAIRAAASILTRGGLVCFPTETVYGLGANALDPRAVSRIFEAKGRPQDNPLIVHVASKEQVRGLVRQLPEVASRAIELFWPGPLTLIMYRSRAVPDVVSSGLDTVAVRMPDHGIALALIGQAGVPVAAPSANLSGRPSPTVARHVLDDLGGRVDCVIDGGPCGYGVESTVLDVTGPVPVVLRPGATTPEALREALGRIEMARVPARGDERGPRSPGMKYVHYAPRARVTALAPAGSAADRWERLTRTVGTAVANGRNVGVIADDPTSEKLRAFLAGHPGGSRAVVRSYGPHGDTSALAARLFALMREFDDLGADQVVVELVPEEGLGFAVNNRLRKAASLVVG